jgi:hypothetical protein
LKTIQLGQQTRFPENAKTLFYHGDHGEQGGFYNTSLFNFLPDIVHKLIPINPGVISGGPQWQLLSQALLFFLLCALCVLLGEIKHFIYTTL